MNKGRILAKCLKTYPHEDDMQEYCDGIIKEPESVRVFHKGRKYPVEKGHYDKKYFKPVKPEVKVEVNAP